VSGPVTAADAEPADGGAGATAVDLEILESREAEVGRFHVRRALPRRGRRTVGPWCFVDHMGPAPVTEEHGLDVAPHPHIGLQTVTWLFAGEALHRDSLGTEQIIAPGQLNLMTAGHGVAHSEEATGRYRGDLHGVQLWVAQPEGTRHGSAAFEHHAELPEVDVGAATATVLVGSLDGTFSPATHERDIVGVDLVLRRGEAILPLDAAREHALVVVEGMVEVDGHPVTPGHLAYLGVGHDECPLAASEPARALLVGGTPFEDRLLMWWNFVGRTQDEITEAYEAWMADDPRFPRVDSPLARIEPDPPPWVRR
jgi:quercetin 2,3-dioxygenase